MSFVLFQLNAKTILATPGELRGQPPDTFPTTVLLRLVLPVVSKTYLCFVNLILIIHQTHYPIRWARILPDFPCFRSFLYVPLHLKRRLCFYSTYEIIE